MRVEILSQTGTKYPAAEDFNLLLPDMGYIDVESRILEKSFCCCGRAGVPQTQFNSIALINPLLGAMPLR
jgi:hypothetical protein